MENISMTNGEYIKKLIEMEELLYEKFREAQQMKQIKIEEMLQRGEIRCNNCKSKVRKISNSFFINYCCETCHKSNDIEKKNRQNIYLKVGEKYKKQKYNHNGWWFKKINS
tara:strand:- start:376 stop:708 length:333 start_codon:yes stop_codon:yes gene_type:complete